jgi:hypothetical protein
MLLGFNTNVPYKGNIYHVQTEDNGVNNPIIVTHLYFKGAILASKKSVYAHLLVEEDWKEKVVEMMKSQHRDVIKELLAGKYTDKPQQELKEETVSERADTKRSLEDIVLDYIISIRK